jgi:hypothetical protein
MREILAAGGGGYIDGWECPNCAWRYLLRDPGWRGDVPADTQRDAEEQLRQHICGEFPR